MTTPTSPSLTDATNRAANFLLFNVIPARVSRFLGSSGQSRAVANVALAATCPALALVLLGLTSVGIGYEWNEMNWFVVYYVSLNWALLYVPQDSWRRLQQVAPDMDALIQDPADRARIATLVLRTVRVDIQLIVGTIAFIAGLIGAAAAAHAKGVSIGAAVPFELSIGFTMFFGTHVVLWITSAVFWLRAMSALPSTRLDPIDAMRSGGISNGYALMTRAQWYATGGLVLAILPLAILYRDTRESTYLHIIVLIAGIGSLVVVVIAYSLPLWYMHVIRRRDKEALLTELRSALPIDFSGLDDAELRALEPRMALYRSVQARPTGGLDRPMLASLIAALVAVSVAFLPLVIKKSSSTSKAQPTQTQPTKTQPTKTQPTQTQPTQTP